MKPHFDKYRYKGEPGDGKIIVVRAHPVFKEEIKQLAELEGDKLPGLCIEGIGRVFEDRIRHPEYRDMIREYRILDSADAGRYIRPEANEYTSRFGQRGEATASISFRSPYTLTKQVEVMTHVERRSITGLCIEGLSIVAEDRRNYPFEMHPHVEGATSIAQADLAEAYRVAQTLLPPDIS